ncbi:hypothetical protein WN48_00633 [Eufriesea mexicana]|uniref:Uncharacterized protein n=1 Tax=Eufriesea mexicana TaxID=516756 RepID=A0A310SBN4_9HYME|nr:hypothetical protein WN48_00633 [Eufriesea mexicana]
MYTGVEGTIGGKKPVQQFRLPPLSIKLDFSPENSFSMGICNGLGVTNFIRYPFSGKLMNGFCKRFIAIMIDSLYLYEDQDDLSDGFMEEISSVLRCQHPLTRGHSSPGRHLAEPQGGSINHPRGDGTPNLFKPPKDVEANTHPQYYSQSIGIDTPIIYISHHKATETGFERVLHQIQEVKINLHHQGVLTQIQSSQDKPNIIKLSVREQ